MATPAAVPVAAPLPEPHLAPSWTLEDPPPPLGPPRPMLAVAAVVALAALVLGATRPSSVVVAPLERLLDDRGRARVALRGIVVEGGRPLLADGQGGAPRIRLEVSAVIAPDGEPTPVETTVELRVIPGAASDRLPRPGDLVELTASLSRVPGRRNPGGVDRRALAARRGVGYEGWLAPEPAVETIGRPISVTAVADDARRAVAAAIRDATDAETAALLAATLLGARASIGRERRETFRRTGTVHLLAISGVHMSILAGLAWLLLAPVAIHGTPSRRAALCLAVVVAYLVIVGPRPSAVRAAIMVGVYLGARAIGRPVDPLQALATAAVVILAADPGALGDAGFQLSFAATGALLVAARVVAEDAGRSEVDAGSDPFAPGTLASILLPAARRGLRFLRGGLVASTVATVATAPILAWHFGVATPGAIVANVVALPLFSVMLGAGALTAALGLVSPGLALVPGAVAAGAAQALVAVLEVVGLVPGSALRVGPPSLLAVLVASAAAVAALALLRRRRRGWTALAVTVSGAALLLGGPAPAPPAGGVRVTALSVGRGPALLVETAREEAWLVGLGAGGSGWRAARIGSALRSVGRRRLDGAHVLRRRRGDEACARALAAWVDLGVDPSVDRAGAVGADATGGLELLYARRPDDPSAGSIVVLRRDGLIVLLADGVSIERLAIETERAGLAGRVDLALIVEPGAARRRHERLAAVLGPTATLLTAGRVSDGARAVYGARLHATGAGAVEVTVAAGAPPRVRRWPAGGTSFW